MANPLIGSRISLISKKNIRYEGTLYSINEKDASVALQNVQSFGTEGRETNGTFVPPQDAVHPYLVFRGPDIKDLHVHERIPNLPPPPPPPPSNPPPEVPEPELISPTTPMVDNSEEIDGTKDISTVKITADKSNDVVKTSEESIDEKKTPSKPSRNNIKRTNRPKKQQQSLQGSQSAPVGTGASLLSRRERGGSHNSSNPQVMKKSNSASRPEVPSDDFDFQSNLANFEKEEQKKDIDEKDANTAEKSAYDKDDFFDSISCDALDKEKGVDNRLRSSQERTLNAETFGAFALDTYRRSTSGGAGRGRSGRSGGRTMNNYYNSSARGSGRGGGGRGRNEREGGRGRGRGGRGRSRYRGDGNLPPEKKLVSA